MIKTFAQVEVYFLQVVQIQEIQIACRNCRNTYASGSLVKLKTEMCTKRTDTCTQTTKYIA